MTAMSKKGDGSAAVSAASGLSTSERKAAAVRLTARAVGGEGVGGGGIQRAIMGRWGFQTI